MKRAHLLSLVVILGPSIFPLAAEPCRVIHGRAMAYSGDGAVRIWHIGTHHEFEPAYKDKASWDLLFQYIDWNSEKVLYADFTICPTEPYKLGSVQSVRIAKIQNPHITCWPNDLK
jgi:hypothetical protein